MDRVLFHIGNVRFSLGDFLGLCVSILRIGLIVRDQICYLAVIGVEILAILVALFFCETIRELTGGIS